MSLSLLTNRQAVLDAMAEYDQLGRDAFLRKYGYRPSRSYFVEHNGRRYDSKAIAGVAVGKQHPDRGPLRGADFIGGDATVRAKLEALGFQMIVDGDTGAKITAADVEQLRQARLSGKLYSALQPEERAAYERINAALQALGNTAVQALGDEYTLRLTSGFNIQAGVRGSQPKDLWFGVYPTENQEAFVGHPQLFLIVSGRGLEYGFAASTHPSDFSNTVTKDKVRQAAPKIFSLLPQPGDSDAARLARELAATGGWTFRRKERLDPGQTDFPTLDAWLAHMHSSAGKAAAAGNISRYVVGEDIDIVDIEACLLEAVEIFRPLMARISSGTRPKTKEAKVMTDSDTFALALQKALAEFDRVRTGHYGRMEPLWTLLKDTVRSLEALLPISNRPHIEVQASLGQGNWARVPWIALLNRNVTTTTESGLYCVFLIANDLSRVYLTLNQGVTALVKELGPRGGAQALAERAAGYRSQAAELAQQGFELGNDIDLASDGRLPSNYKQGTVAYVELATDRLPSDQELSALLEPLLAAYDKLAVATATEHVFEPVGDATEADLPPYTLDDAMDGLFIDRAEFEQMLATWKFKKNVVLQGAPGVGKSFVARRLAYALIGAKDDRRVEAVQFHQSFGYEDFVQGYRPDGSGGFARCDGTFFRFCQQALKDPARDYVFIIDEINRGNLSKIFGELMLLIEHDKRAPEWAAQLTYAKEGEDRFYVPGNVYVIGMMNTADRSLSMVDYALRRRFAFFRLEPKFESTAFRTHLQIRGVPEPVIDRIVERMTSLNDAIVADRINLGSGFQIGHSFFVPPGEVGDPELWFKRVIETEIRPLLDEYWFDDADKAENWRSQLLTGVL